MLGLCFLEQLHRVKQHRTEHFFPIKSDEIINYKHYTGTVLPVLSAQRMLSILPRAVHSSKLLRAGACVSFAVITRQHIID
jgi:hypothetical protein